MQASGYYEWQDTPAGKQPHYFTRTDGQVISFAGLWDEWKDRPTGETLKSCTMIITEPNAMVAEVHDRMPVLLEPGGAIGLVQREPFPLTAPGHLTRRRPLRCFYRVGDACCSAVDFQLATS
jgi:SOS response associated peptidase (SRAP)